MTSAEALKGELREQILDPAWVNGRPRSGGGGGTCHAVHIDYDRYTMYFSTSYARLQYAHIVMRRAQHFTQLHSIYSISGRLHYISIDYRESLATLHKKEA